MPDTKILKPEPRGLNHYNNHYNLSISLGFGEIDSEPIGLLSRLTISESRLKANKHRLSGRSDSHPVSGFRKPTVTKTITSEAA